MRKCFVFSLAVISLTGSFVAAVTSSCQRALQAHQYKCSCQENSEDPGSPLVTCSNLLQLGELQDAISYLERSRQPVTTLVIENSTLLHLTGGIFKNLRLRKIRLVSVDLLTLETSGRRNPFEGLEDTLQSLEVVGIFNAQHWDYSKLRILRKLSLLYFDKCTMTFVNREKFRQLPNNLQSLYIMNGEMENIDDGAFRSLHLKTLDLSNNVLDGIPNNALPQDLEILVLENNRFWHFPVEILENQPRLSQIVLRKNRIKYFGPGVLEKLNLLASRNQYISINLRENPIKCCKFSRLTDQQILRYIEGTCTTNGGTEFEIKDLSIEMLKRC